MLHRFRRASAVAVLAVAALLPSNASVFASAAPRADGGHQPAAPAAYSPVDLPPLATPIAPPQQVARKVVIESKLTRRHGKVELVSAKGTHVWTVSALAEHDIPLAALKAYKNAAAEMARERPSCQIPWTLLAGIGRVESNHGRYGGSVLGSDGISRPRILGVPLNGKGAVAAVPDTDNGRLDGDKVWDRAVGPMQFLPSTWRNAGRDGDGDGVKNPNDINDAALAAAAYLCPTSGSIRAPGAMQAAIFRYNPSHYYVELVMAFMRGYATGVFVIPSPPAPPAAHHPQHHRHRSRPLHRHTARKHHAVKTVTVKPAHHRRHRASTATTTPSPKPSSSPSPKPSRKHARKRSPTPPTPTPTPTQPVLVTVTGTWTQCGTTYCLNGTALKLGSPKHLAKPASADFDGNGTVDTNAQEFTGLATLGQPVTVQVDQATQVEVYTIAGYPYRNADGSFVS